MAKVAKVAKKQDEASSAHPSQIDQSQASTSMEKKTTPAKSGLSKTRRAGLVFSVLVILRKLRGLRKFKRQVKPDAAVYLASVIEYLTAEILELASLQAKEGHRHFITPRHLQLAVRSDDELDKLFQNVTIAEGGVIPFILPVLLPKPSGRRSSIHQQAE